MLIAVFVAGMLPLPFQLTKSWNCILAMHLFRLGPRVHSLATVAIAGIAFQAGYALGTYRFIGERKKYRKVPCCVLLPLALLYLHLLCSSSTYSVSPPPALFHLRPAVLFLHLLKRRPRATVNLHVLFPSSTCRSRLL